MMLACVLCLCVAGVQALSIFLDRIPNGRRVPHPCLPDRTWITVGHSNLVGGKDALNAFGKHFREEGYRWTVALCKKDSDRDGRTNGDELGDPNCTWSIGQSTASRNVSHPGIVCTMPWLRRHRN